jgi:signal transduction histidine kinase
MKVFGTVRFRLALWNVGVIAIVLVFLGSVLRFKIEQDLLSRENYVLAAISSRAQHAADVPNALPSFLYRHGISETLNNDAEVVPNPVNQPSDSSAVNTASSPPAVYAISIINTAGIALLPDHPALDNDAIARALSGERTFATIKLNGQPLRVLSAPILRNGKVLCVLQFSRPLLQDYNEVDRITRGLLTLVPLALLTVGAGALLLTERALRPVRDIVQATEGIEATDLSGRLSERGSDEFSDLASTINNMLVRLEKAFRLLQEASEQQRRFTADASHELRTPLTIIKANTSLSLSTDRSKEQYRQTIDAVDRAADRMGKIVQDLLYIARSDAGQLFIKSEPVYLRSAVKQSIEAIADLKGHTISDADLSPGLITPGDEDALIRLFTNLLQNASNYTPPGGLIITKSFEKDRWNYVQVSDTGIGIAEEHIEHLGERFFRVDDGRDRDAGGTGLGLAICRSIVAAHNGEFSIESTIGVGTTVTVKLPSLMNRTAALSPVETIFAKSGS